jgi:hypothetical protein
VHIVILRSCQNVRYIEDIYGIKFGIACIWRISARNLIPRRSYRGLFGFKDKKPGSKPGDYTLLILERIMVESDNARSQEKQGQVFLAGHIAAFILMRRHLEKHIALPEASDLDLATECMENLTGTIGKVLDMQTRQQH